MATRLGGARCCWDGAGKVPGGITDPARQLGWSSGAVLQVLTNPWVFLSERLSLRQDNLNLLLTEEEMYSLMETFQQCKIIPGECCPSPRLRLQCTGPWVCILLPLGATEDKSSTTADSWWSFSFNSSRETRVCRPRVRPILYTCGIPRASHRHPELQQRTPSSESPGSAGEQDFRPRFAPCLFTCQDLHSGSMFPWPNRGHQRCPMQSVPVMSWGWGGKGPR